MRNQIFMSGLTALLSLAVAACTDLLTDDEPDQPSLSETASSDGVPPPDPETRQAVQDPLAGDTLVLSPPDSVMLNCGLNKYPPVNGWTRYCIRNCNTNPINRRVALSNGGYGPCLRIAAGGQVCDYIRGNVVGMGACSPPIN